jgi:DNA-binding NarL/FixJ family response regulator
MARPGERPDVIPLNANSSVQRRRILIVDDGDAVRDIIRIFLEKEGLEVCGEAVDGVEAVEKAKTLKPDLIVLDLAMPGMNGVEAASVLSNAMPGIPIIVLTMYEEFLGSSLGSVSGIRAVISKTDTLNKLVARVKDLLPPVPAQITGAGVAPGPE